MTEKEPADPDTGARRIRVPEPGEYRRRQHPASKSAADLAEDDDERWKTALPDGEDGADRSRPR